MRRISVFTLACSVLMVVPSVAGAQGAPSDPKADSPSGVVYELPVDRARKDAAPRRSTQQSQSQGDSDSSGGGGDTSDGGSGSSGAVAGTSETSIRSENNFGTSSAVPGAGSRAGTGPDDAGAGTDKVRGSVETLADRTALSTAGAADGPSDGVVYPLLAVLVAVGAGIGLFAGHRSLRGRPE